MLKGIINASGYEYRETHELDVLVNRYQEVLDKEQQRMPFIYALTASNGDQYRLRFFNNNVQLLKRISGSYSLLGSVNLANTYIPLTLSRKPGFVAVLQGRATLLKSPDASVREPLVYEKAVTLPLAKERIEKLKRLGGILRTPREEAFYNERLFSQVDAEEAAEHLAGVYEASMAFEIRERIIGSGLA